MLEAAFLAREGETSLASTGPCNKQFTVNLTSSHEIREGRREARAEAPYNIQHGDAAKEMSMSGPEKKEEALKEVKEASSLSEVCQVDHEPHVCF